MIERWDNTIPFYQNEWWWVMLFIFTLWCTRCAIILWRAE